MAKRFLVFFPEAHFFLKMVRKTTNESHLFHSLDNQCCSEPNIFYFILTPKEMLLPIVLTRKLKFCYGHYRNWGLVRDLNLSSLAHKASKKKCCSQN